jgi:hypothetical protein
MHEILYKKIERDEIPDVLIEFEGFTPLGIKDIMTLRLPSHVSFVSSLDFPIILQL